MSRIGKQPIDLPAGVKVDIQGATITATGKNGTLSRTLPDGISAEIADGKVTVSRSNDSREQKSLHGLSRTLVNNMVVGVDQGYSKDLVIEGTGFKAQVQGQKLVLWLGFASPKEFAIPEGLTVKVDEKSQTRVTVSGPDKQVVGDAAARIRGFYPVEPYKGKGIHYAGEKIRRKQGKKVA
ncbi:MAG: 50S ribosomal protein L6 [Kiritimatiellia bacterium]|jgi:large subunit ribosomal protein L6